MGVLDAGSTDSIGLSIEIMQEMFKSSDVTFVQFEVKLGSVEWESDVTIELRS